MRSKKINESEIESLKVSSLPTRPTAPAAFGGKGYTADELKAAFDALPLYIIEKFNSLIDDLTTEGEDGILADILTGIKSGHTLRDMLSDIRSGDFVSYLAVGDLTLGEYLAKMKTDLDKVALKVGINL